MESKECFYNWNQLAMDHLPVGLIVIDRKAEIKVFNQTLARLTGLNNTSVIGRSFTKVFYNKIFDDSKPYSNILLQTVCTGTVFEKLKPQTLIPVIMSTGYEGSTYPIKDKKGVTIGAIAVFIPVQQQQELGKAVIKAEKLAILGQLAASAVHEIKNPLTTINGFLQLLLKDLKGSPKEEYLEIMLSELKHVNKLITDFLKLAKPGYSKRIPHDINRLITEVFMLVESEASIRNVKISLEADNDIPCIQVDGEQLKQVFLNIIKNAFDALKPGDKISIKTSWNQAEGIIRIIIRDNGTGMDQQTITRMFDPFFTTKEDGTGLGMFISKKIIDNHGGSIKVESKKGQGTKVTIFLPGE